MKRLGMCVALLLVALAVGCDQGGSGSSAKKGPAPSADSAKAVLNDMASSGHLGSGMMTIDTYLNSLKASDAAKAEALTKEVTELKSLGSKPDALKAKAKEIAGKL